MLNRKRINIWIEPNWLNKLKEEKEKYGHTTVSGFLRYIVIKFFENPTIKKL